VFAAVGAADSKRAGDIIPALPNENFPNPVKKASLAKTSATFRFGSEAAKCSEADIAQRAE